MNRIARGACVLMCLWVPLGAAAEVIQTKERTYAVKFKDGAVERYTVKWALDFKADVREVGGSPIPYQGSVDVRRCSWTVDATVARSVSLVTRLGEPFPLPRMVRDLSLDAQNPGKPYRIAGQRDTTCKAVQSQSDGEIGNARATVVQGFERLTGEDFAGLMKEAQANADVVSVTAQP